MSEEQTPERAVGGAIAVLRAMPVEVTPVAEVVARGRRRRRRVRVSSGAAALALAVVLGFVVVGLGDGDADTFVTTGTTVRELVLPDGSRIELTLPEPSPDAGAGTSFAVAAVPAGRGPQPACCAREIVVLDRAGLAATDEVRPVETVSSTRRDDGLVVDTVRRPGGEVDLRFHFADWTAVVGVRGGGLPDPMDAVEEARWRDGLGGGVTDAGVALRLPDGWTYTETARPLASVDGIGIIGPATRELQCRGTERGVGSWTVYGDDPVRLCRADLPVVLGLSADVGDAALASLDVTVVTAGPLLAGPGG